jgi:hypothetical protein
MPRVAVWILALASPAVAQPPTPGYVIAEPYEFTPLSPGQHNLALTSKTALTLPNGASYAVVCASVSTVKYTTDGTTALTAAIGQPLMPGSCVSLSGSLVLKNFRAFSATGTIDVEYFQ